LIFLLFAALVLVSAMLTLAASGHFPSSSRDQKLRSIRGTAFLFGSIVVGTLSLLAGVGAAIMSLPWYAVVIGAGAGILFAPLMLQMFSDRFVDGYGALAVFSATAAAAIGLIELVKQVFR
jgi:uncharacterized membrane protein YfcA